MTARAAILVASLFAVVGCTAVPSGNGTGAPATGTSAPAASPGAGLGPFTEIFTDDFSDPASGWGTGTADAGSIARDEPGALTIEVTQKNQTLRSGRVLREHWNVLRIEAAMTPIEGEGRLGLLCGESINDTLGGMVATSGGVIFFRLAGGVATLIARDDEAGGPRELGRPVRLAFECAGTSTGSTRLRLEADDELLFAHDGTAEGPAAFNHVAIHAEATGESFAMRADDVWVGAAAD